jgi:hypothetical protein
MGSRAGLDGMENVVPTGIRSPDLWQITILITLSQPTEKLIQNFVW